MGEEPQQQPAALDPLADEKAGKVGYLRLKRLRIERLKKAMQIALWQSNLWRRRQWFESRPRHALLKERTLKVLFKNSNPDPKLCSPWISQLKISRIQSLTINRFAACPARTIIFNLVLYYDECVRVKKSKSQTRLCIISAQEEFLLDKKLFCFISLKVRKKLFNTDF